MRNTLLFFLLSTTVATMNPKAQSWVNGGNTLSANGTIGTNSSHSLLFETSGVERGRITNGGNWAIGSTGTPSKFTVNSASGVSPFRAQIAGGTKLIVNGNGSTSIGSFTAGPANGLYVVGSVGIGTATPFRTFELAGDQRLTSSTSPRYLEFLKPGASAPDYRLEHSSAGSYLYISASTNDFASFCDIARFSNCSDTYKFTVYGNALASGGVWQASDLKLKNNIADMSNAMDIINKLKPRTYFFKTNEYNKLNLSGKKQYGFIAQELEQVIPELVITSTEETRDSSNGERNAEEIKSINYTAIIPLLVKAVQEQQQVINELKNELLELKQAMTKLSNGQSTNADVTSAQQHHH
ncbi:tail fiber domain-containing protein [Chitinophagaceae bacterium LB-8]|uniref:Tail fiber domain-containing protein n=1 Tax=Paraflavisolibacter caeni TaxID=2982496 RepID=A0A9X2XYI2_9BACT|nr:tail fiber domain-containing protein [Paraflavisolibacter caeni]MCU7549948.1 tail fiber domain-containing protein [Paraflavisolibacter caeni]